MVESRNESRQLRDEKVIWQMLFSAWLVAIVSTLSVFFIGEVMGQAPCLLCWYQRIFMVPLAVILAIACFLPDPKVWRYALPLAGVGWLIAVYHSLLVTNLIPKPIEPCGAGPSCSGADMMILGVLPIPLLSAGAFSLIIVLLYLIRQRLAT